MKVAIEVHLGNEAMQSGEEVVTAIKQSLGRTLLMSEPFRVGDLGTVVDANGNTVGRWEVVES